MKNFSQDSEVLQLVAPYTVLSGQGALVDSIFGVAISDTAIGVLGSFVTEGIVALKKTASQAWTVGQRVYWDDVARESTNDPTKGPLIGAAARTADSGAALITGYVDLNEGPTRTGENQILLISSPAPTSISTVGPATLTAAQLLSGLIVRDTNGASRTDTLPTAALLVAAIPNAKVGMMIKTKIVNGADAAEVLTIAAGVGGAFDANQTASSQVIGQNISKELCVRLTNVTLGAEAYVAYL